MSKGNDFEWHVAREISMWLTDGADKKQLIRSVQSGGWQGRAIPQVGDLAPNGEAGATFREWAAVECKHYQPGPDGFSWWHTFTSKDPTFAKWWMKHITECNEHNLVPLIFIRVNFRPIVVGYHDVFEFPKSVDVTLRKIHLPYWELSFVTWEQFKEVDPSWYYRNWI